MTDLSRKLLGTLCLILSIALLIYVAKEIFAKTGDRDNVDTNNLSTVPPATPAAPATDKEFAKPDVQEGPPPESGLHYHALELKDLPDATSRELITVDAWSFPTPIEGGGVYYQSLPYRQAIVGKMAGLVFERTLEPNICIFDIMVNNPSGDFLEGTDVEIAGQLAVETPDPENCPNNRQPWDVEPETRFEGRTESGIVMSIPRVRFWRYHDTGQPLAKPKVIIVPPSHLETH